MRDALFLSGLASLFGGLFIVEPAYALIVSGVIGVGLGVVGAIVSAR